jgi:P-type E1-E2 ATPase
LQCTQIEPLGNVDETTSLAIAAALEKHVTHPIATSICKRAQNTSLPEIRDIQVIAGFGIKGRLADGTLVSIGRPTQNQFSNEEQAVALLDVGGSQTIFRFSDEVRPTAKKAIDDLQIRCNLTSMMITGDHASNAATVAKTLGIKTYFSDIKPEEKLLKVAEFSSLGGLAMVGDGINDAPALARATVGISMGKIGSATAVDASDVVLLNDDLTLLPNLFLKAKKTQTIVRQNLTLALSVIACATLPALLGLIPLWIAVILHEGGTVLVGLNSLRLLLKR